jgi:endonuclease-3
MSSSKTITGLLFKKYPNPEIALHFRNPFELLVATILSAQCPDTRVNQVTKTLFMRYSTPEQFIQAGSAKLEGEIAIITYYRSKTKSIIDCCNKLVVDFSGEVPRTMEELITLPGVGRKTANVILGCAFGLPALAVDTHVLRVTNRLGLSHSKNPDNVEKELMQQIAPAAWTRFSLALILHGRETCIARQPLCSVCVLYLVCDWPEKTLYRKKNHAAS